MISMEFLAQMGALVGTSAVLYYVTQPSTKNELLLQQMTSSSSSSSSNSNSNSSSSNTNTMNHQQSVIIPLSGIQRYSSYHRIRYHKMISQSNSSNNNN